MIPLAELKSAIKTGHLTSLYVFTGPEVAIMDTYIELICKAVSATRVNFDSAAEVIVNCKNRSMLNPGTKCYIVRNDKEYTQLDKSWASLLETKIQKENIVILVYTSLDKRTKFYKSHNHRMVEFEYLSSTVLAKYIQKQVRLSLEDAEYLADICNCDYSRIKLECDKIESLALSRYFGLENGHAQAFDDLLNERLIYIPPKDAIFDLVDAICRGTSMTDAFYLLGECEALGEHPLAILSVLYKNLRAQYVVAMDGGGAGITERTGLNGFQVKLALEKGNAYSTEQLYEAIKVVREAEKGIKTGVIDAEYAVLYSMIKILASDGFPF